MQCQRRDLSLPLVSSLAEAEIKTDKASNQTAPLVLFHTACDLKLLYRLIGKKFSSEPGEERGRR